MSKTIPLPITAQAIPGMLLIVLMNVMAFEAPAHAQSIGGSQGSMAAASQPPFTKIALNFIQLFHPRDFGCPPASSFDPRVHMTSSDVTDLTRDFDRSKDKDYCSAFEDAYLLSIQPSEHDRALYWLDQGLGQLLKKPDYEAVAGYGLSGLKEFSADHPNDPSVAEIRWKMVQATTGAAKELGTQHDPTWNRYALGQAPVYDPSLLTPTGFLRDFPQSKHVDEAKALEKEMVDIAIDREEGIASEGIKQEEYGQAISHLKDIYLIPGFAETGRAAEVHYKLMEAWLKFAKDMTDPALVSFYRRNGIVVPQWTGKRVGDFFHDLDPNRDPNPFTSENEMDDWYKLQKKLIDSSDSASAKAQKQSESQGSELIRYPDPNKHPHDVTRAEAIAACEAAAAQEAHDLAQVDPSEYWAAKANSLLAQYHAKPAGNEVPSPTVPAELAQKMIQGFPHSAQACPLPDIHAKNGVPAAQRLESDYKAQVGAENACKAFSDAYLLAYSPSQNARALLWLNRALDQLQAVHDYRAATILALKGLSALAKNPKDPEIAETRWRIVRAAYDAAQEEGSAFDPDFGLFSIGFSQSWFDPSRFSDTAASARFLSIAAFLADFPDSKHAQEATAMAQSTASALQGSLPRLIDREESIAAEDTENGKYNEALDHLSSLTLIPGFAESDKAAEVIYRAVENELKLEADVSSPAKWSDRKIQSVFHDVAPDPCVNYHPCTQIVPLPVTRERVIAVIKQMTDQGIAALNQLDSTGTWAAKANQLLLAQSQAPMSAPASPVADPRESDTKPASSEGVIVGSPTPKDASMDDLYAAYGEAQKSAQ